MKALILSGGKGTRLRPITHTIAKQLVPVANKPILHYCLDNIVKANINDIGIVISPDTGKFVQESVNNWLKTNSVKVSYILQEEPLGIAHAVKVSRDFLKDDPFIMYLGDNLIKYDINELVRKFIDNKNDLSILLKEVENPRMFGVASIQNNKIINLEEKPANPTSNLALVGVYLFNKKIHQAIDNIKPSWRGELEITDAIKHMLDNSSSVDHTVLQDWWLDTGKKDDLLSANRIILDELKDSVQRGEIDQTSKIDGRVHIDEGTRIINSIIRGPVLIGKNCIIENSYIGPYTSLSDNVAINSSEIEYSVVMNNSSILNVKKRIQDSLIGSEVKIEFSNQIPQVHKFLVGDNSDIILNDC